MFSKLHHIAIICSNYERSKEFYTKILGFKILHELYREEKASYKLDLYNDSLRIELFSFPNSPPRLSQPEACGLRHISFAVKDVLLVKNSLEAHRVKVEEVRTDKITGARYTFFQDPDGLPFEIYELLD